MTSHSVTYTQSIESTLQSINLINGALVMVDVNDHTPFPETLKETLKQAVEAGHPEVLIIRSEKSFAELAQLLENDGVDMVTITGIVSITGQPPVLKIGDQQPISLTPTLNEQDTALISAFTSPKEGHKSIQEKIVRAALIACHKSTDDQQLTEMSQHIYVDAEKGKIEYGALLKALGKSADIPFIENRICDIINEEINAHRFQEQKSPSTRLDVVMLGNSEIVIYAHTNPDQVAANALPLLQGSTIISGITDIPSANLKEALDTRLAALAAQKESPRLILPSGTEHNGYASPNGGLALAGASLGRI